MYRKRNFYLGRVNLVYLALVGELVGNYVGHIMVNDFSQIRKIQFEFSDSILSTNHDCALFKSFDRVLL